MYKIVVQWRWIYFFVQYISGKKYIQVKSACLCLIQVTIPLSTLPQSTFLFSVPLSFSFSSVRMHSPPLVLWCFHAKFLLRFLFSQFFGTFVFDRRLLVMMQIRKFTDKHFKVSDFRRCSHVQTSARCRRLCCAHNATCQFCWIEWLSLWQQPTSPSLLSPMTVPWIEWPTLWSLMSDYMQPVDGWSAGMTLACICLVVIFATVVLRMEMMKLQPSIAFTYLFPERWLLLFLLVVV